MNWTILLIVLLVVAVIIILMLLKNRKDKKELEQTIMNDYRKPRDEEDDIDTEDQSRM